VTSSDPSALQPVLRLLRRLRPPRAVAEAAVADRVVSKALVATARPDRYGKQLTSHMSKRITTSWDEAARTGVLDFGRGRADLTCVDGGLQLTLGCAAADVAGLEDAVGRHLVRFGARDELVVTWVHQDGSPGTEQRKLED
jgi:hypothetical protein